MSDAVDLVGKIMDKAASADRRALFAAVQAAVGGMADMAHRSESFEDGLRRIDEALDVGAPYGSPEQLAYLERKFGRDPATEGSGSRSAPPHPL